MINKAIITTCIMALHFQVVHPSVNKFCMSWYLFIYWNDFNETSTNICHGKKWKGYQSLGSRSRSLGIHLPNLNLMSFSTHVSVSVCVQICEWYVVEAYILTVWSTHFFWDFHTKSVHFLLLSWAAFVKLLSACLKLTVMVLPFHKLRQQLLHY